MFGRLLKKKVTKSEEDVALENIIQKVSTMNLTEMRTFIRGKVVTLPICANGLNAVLSRLIEKDEKSQKLYINSDDMDSKKKKSFDLVIAMASSKFVNVMTVELIQKFMEVYKELIESYDTEHKEIYSSRLNDAIKAAINTINALSELNDKISVLGDK